MIAVAVCQKDGADRLRSDLADLREKILGACFGLLGVDDDHAGLSDVDGAVASRAAEPYPDIGLQLFHHHRLNGRCLCEGGSRRDDRGSREYENIEVFHNGVLSDDHYKSQIPNPKSQVTWRFGFLRFGIGVWTWNFGIFH
jgi:hypothetical protein